MKRKKRIQHATREYTNKIQFKDIKYSFEFIYKKRTSFLKHRGKI